MEVCPEHGLRLREDPTDALIGRVFVGRFQIERRIGGGAMGAVYLARQLSVDRPVALKLLHPEMAADRTNVHRFLLEAKATSRLTNPHTVTTYDFGQSEEGILFLAMEYLEGRNLRRRLAEEGTLPAEEAIRIMLQVCDSLAEAHAQDIFHRDLKPENVFLVEAKGRSRTVKVLDFGIAKAAELTGAVKLTARGTVAGTPYSMAPESAEGYPVDARCDVYAMGVMLFEMVTGSPPFVEESAPALMLAHIERKPPRIRDVAPHAEVPRKLRDLIYRCLAKQPSARPADAAAMRYALRQVLAEVATVGSDTVTELATIVHLHPNMSSGAPQATVPRGEGAKPRQKARGRAVAGLVTVVIAVLGALAFVLAGREDAVTHSPPPADASSRAAEDTVSRAETDAPPVADAGIEAAVVAVEPGPEVDAAEPDAVDIAAEVAPPARVSVEITSAPRATVILDGKRLGSTPQSLALDRGSEPVPLRLVAAGYEIETSQVVPDADKKLAFTLRRKAAAKKALELLP